MPTGVIVSPDRSSANVIDNVVSTARAAHEAGVRQVWLPQNFNYDAVALAVDPGVMPVSLALAGGTPFPVYVAAMGPRALRVTGELADGTPPNLAGPRTIEQFIVPTIGQAATDAGRPSPKIIGMVQVAVTDDADTVRAAAAGRLALYETVPSYRKVLDREGVAKAADLAVIGDARAVTAQLRKYLDAGATDVLLVPLQAEPDDLRRVWDLATGSHSLQPSRESSAPRHTARLPTCPRACLKSLWRNAFQQSDTNEPKGAARAGRGEEEGPRRRSLAALMGLHAQELPLSRAYVAHADQQLSYKLSYTRVMADTITFRPDDDTSKALQILTKDGTPVSAAVRSALIDAARRKASAAIRTEAERLAEDESDRAETMQVLRDMETLRAW
jgi:Luciferase-like monooxygenase